MIASRITFAVISLLLLLAFAPFALRLQLAQALTDATSSTTTVQLDSLPVSTTTATTTAASAPQSPTMSAHVSAPSAFTVVRIIGTKYIDYCTDGTKITSYPGDAAIDTNLNKLDASPPKCPNGLKWDHTSGMDAYDTPTGDLEVGQYAELQNGTFAVH